MQNTNLTNQAVAEGGAYDIIRKRLEAQGKQLTEQINTLNTARLEEFGSSDMQVISRLRVRTENNCIARDIVPVGDYLMFAYNVFMGMKKETHISDVFSLYRLLNTGNEEDDQYEMEAVNLHDSFLNQANFTSDFNELYTYYKGAHLTQLVVKNNKLLAAFQIGDRLTDIRVFRWQISPQGEVNYIDNRGERDIALPQPYDFDWIETGRDNTVNGRHPHMNILDTIFVETIGGDLTIKIEDNTKSGLGIYSEPVEDETQSLDDANIQYAEVGELILLKILPYREENWRYLVFNKITHDVQRIDAIGQSCIQLPENHGIIFPDGIYLKNGESKRFNDDISGLRFKQAIRSPNGEDIVYIFYRVEDGESALYSYNLIEKSLQNPLFGHGYAILENGTMVIFNTEGEATRTHPMQIWQTPFTSEEFASQQDKGTGFYAKIGNSELVRGISDLYSITREINNQSISSAQYNQLIQNTRRLFDAYYWLDDDKLSDIHALLHEIAKTSELVLDEFEKVEAIQKQASEAIQQAQAEQTDIIASILPDSWYKVEDFVDALTRIRQQRGHLATIKEYRYINQDAIQILDTQLLETQDTLGKSTVKFLSSEKALKPYAEKLSTLEKQLETVKTRKALDEPIAGLDKMSADLDLLSELMASLKVDDATIRTAIIDAISEIYAKLNQTKARAKHKKKDLGSAESIAQFSAQFKLFSQSIANALNLSTTPNKTDEQLSRLLIQLEELESQFSEYDEFLGDIISKRDEIYETFEAHKQSLVDERQRKAQNLLDAANRILSSIQRRTEKFQNTEQLNTFYASDTLIMKTRGIAQSLRDLDDSVKADDIESRLKSGKDQAFRSLRDKTEIYEDGGNIIKLGAKHRFSVNTQTLDLTLLPRGDELNIHLTGTDFFEPVDVAELNELSDYWQQNLLSETDDFYRAEYLAGQILETADKGENKLSLELLNKQVQKPKQLLETVKTFAAPRYKEGYEKGIHDHDAAKLLDAILPLQQTAGLLKFDPLQRGLAVLFWSLSKEQEPQKSWIERAKSAAQMKQVFGQNDAQELLQNEIQAELRTFLKNHPIEAKHYGLEKSIRDGVAAYLVQELATGSPVFVSSLYARKLANELRRSLDVANIWDDFNTALDQLAHQPEKQWSLLESWLTAMLKSQDDQQTQNYIPETVALLIVEGINYQNNDTALEFSVDGLMGEHTLIQKQSLNLSLDRFLSRYQYHAQIIVPSYHHYHQLRSDVIERQREQLRLDEFKPRPLSSFVRNRLINEQYLPLIGDNLAKQMGTIGENKRSDLMGLLMMISPPGYGKTTLMEYVASRLGLVFMKINCPSLGHSVVSLDPAQAPDSASKQELEKLNMGLEMGNNVMLYLDDIQHTDPEFLQKFISLSDGTRRIEGVWKGKARTYDMRGKKFCIVMAGNPYTESGEAFKIPDMLANRADIYNLGDILGGAEEAFSLSYIENTLTSNAVLAPLATRDMSDVYKLFDMAKGKAINSTDLNHDYSSAERNEIIEVLKKLFRIQEVVLKVNQQYIASAAQSDEYRTEPSFKLQGSYRNMNKMAEKVSAIMNENELMQMIEDHYLGEAQLLTSGAEENLLKLAELRGNMTDAEQERWEKIKQDYQRNKLADDQEFEIGRQIAGKLQNISEALNQPETQALYASRLDQLADSLQAIKTALSQHDNKQLSIIAKQLNGIYKQLHHSSNTETAIQLESISTTLKALQKVLLNSKADDDIGSHLQQISEHLENGILPEKASQDVVTQLAKVVESVQFMGQELSEMSESSQKKLKWLTGFRRKT